MVDFILVLFEYFRQLSRLRRYERIFIEIVVRKWVRHSDRNFQGKWGRPPTTVSVRKLVSGLSRDVVCVILRLAVLTQYRGV